MNLIFQDLKTHSMIRGFYRLLIFWFLISLGSGCISTEKTALTYNSNTTQSMGCDAFIDNTQKLPESLKTCKQENTRLIKWPNNLLRQAKKRLETNWGQSDLKNEMQTTRLERRPKSVVPYIAFFLIIGVLLVLMAAGITISTEAWAIIALGSVILLVLLFVFT